MCPTRREVQVAGHKLRGWPGLIFFAGVILAACSSAGPTHSHISSAVTAHFKGVPNGIAVRRGNATPWAERADGRAIYVMTWGSGSCPSIPRSVRARGPHRVVIDIVEHDFVSSDNSCSADLAVTTSRVRLPSSVASSQALTVRVDGTDSRVAASAP